MDRVLIVIDAQEDFTRGALGSEEAIAALPVIHEAVEYAYEHFSRPIYYTKDTHVSKDYYLTRQEGKNLPIPHCIRNTQGWRICNEVLIEKSVVLEKEHFGYLDWDLKLGSIDEIWLCGFCTDICVMANFQILKAKYPETKIIVIEDACAGVTPERHEAALEVMKSCQATVGKWEDLKPLEETNYGR